MRVILELFSGTVREEGRVLALAPRERELLFTIAARDCGLRSDVSVASVNQRVTVWRIRSRFRGEILRAQGRGGYVLAPSVRIDLRAFRIFGATAGDYAQMRCRYQHRAAVLRERLAAHPDRHTAWFGPIALQLEEIVGAVLAESVTAL